MHLCVRVDHIRARAGTGLVWALDVRYGEAMRIAVAVSVAAVVSIAAQASAQPLGFDDLPDATVVTDQYAARGVVFGSDGQAPSTFGVFGSPASFRNYLVGEHEGTEDKNDSSEFGNGKPARDIVMRFVSGDGAGATARVAMVITYLNVGSVARVQAMDAQGAVVAEATVTGRLGGFALPVEVRGASIARVRVRFERADGFEDNAGIDDLSFDPVGPLR